MMIYIIVEYIIDYLLFIQESFQVLESVVQEVNKKIQLEDRNLCLLFFFCTGYRKSSLGWKMGVTILLQFKNIVYTFGGGSS